MRNTVTHHLYIYNNKIRIGSKYGKPTTIPTTI